MLIANYHTHTDLCHHADGTALDYAKTAQKDGCLELGFSDHCPYPHDEKDNWHYCRMDLTEVPLYKKYVEEAKDAVDFPVYFGFECEWDSDYKSWYEDKLKGEFGAEYLVLGSHWVTEGNEHIYIKNVDSDALLNKYIDQTIEGARSGLYSFLAHPDLFMAGRGDWDSQAEECSKALLYAAKELNLPLEINGYGIIKAPVVTAKETRFQYPVKEFWQLAKEIGNTVICNSDSHSPKYVIENNVKARKFAEELGITVMDKINL